LRGHDPQRHLNQSSVKTIKRKAPTSEFDAFTDLVDRVLAVPRDEILRREKEYRKGVDANPKRRGPKRKVKPSVAGRESGEGD